MANVSRAEQASAFLIAAGIAASSGNTWPIKLGRLLPDPDAQISITDTVGLTPNPKFRLDFPTIQILVRGPQFGYTEGWNKIAECRDVLLGMDPVTLSNGDRWDGVVALGDAGLISWDERNRPIFSANYRIFFEPVATSLTNRESL